MSDQSASGIADVPPKEPPFKPPEPLATLLAQADITLHAYPSDTGKAAFSALEHSGVVFEVVRMDFDQAPVAEWGDARFEEVEAIELLAGQLRDARIRSINAAERDLPDLLEDCNPTLRQWVIQMRRAKVEEARRVLFAAERTVESGAELEH